MHPDSSNVLQRRMLVTEEMGQVQTPLRRKTRCERFLPVAQEFDLTLTPDTPADNPTVHKEMAPGSGAFLPASSGVVRQRDQPFSHP